MLLNIRVPDETYEVYARRNPSNPRVELEKSLLAFQDLDPKTSGLVLTAEELKELNILLGHPISTPGELLEHLKRSERASLGEGVELQLSVGQRSRMKSLADFFQQDFKEYVKNEVTQALVAKVGP